MLDTRPESLWLEVERAEEYRRHKLSHRNNLVQEFHGPMWGNASESQDSSENHTYEYITNIVPRLIFNNPRASVRTRRNTAPHRLVAEAMSLGLERWIADSSIRETLRMLATDMMFGWGYSMITFEERPDLTAPEDIDVEEMGWPVIHRLSPDHVYFDPEALSIGEARFVGHKYRVDLEDLIEEAAENADGTWNAGAVSDLQPASFDDSQALRRVSDSANRDEVWVYEVWVPEDTPEEDDELHSGRIHTLAITSGDKEPQPIREPRDYYGPETGPYTMFGAYYVPDHPAPLAPLVATASQARDLNQLSRSITRSAKAYKSIILTANNEMADIVQSGPDKHVFSTGSRITDDMVRQLNLGGIQREQLVAQEDMRAKMQRISGLSDAMKGQANTGSTATADQIANAGSNMRVDFLRQAFEANTTSILTDVAWFLFNDDTVAFALNVEGGNGDEGELWFQGGPTAGVEMSYGDLELSIEPYSMERTNDSIRMKRRMDGVTLAMQMAQMMPMAPHINWKELFQDVGDAWNIPDYDSRVNWKVLEEMWKQQGMAAQAENSGPAAAPAKMVGRDGAPDIQVAPAGRRSGAQAPIETS